MQDRKSTSLLTVLKTLAQIPRTKQLCALPWTFQLAIPEVRDGLHSASGGAQHVTPVHLRLLLFPLFLCDLRAVEESFKHGGGGGIHGPGIQAGGSSPAWGAFAVLHSSPGLAPQCSQGWTQDPYSTGGCSWGGQGHAFQQQQGLSTIFHPCFRTGHAAKEAKHGGQAAKTRASMSWIHGDGHFWFTLYRCRKTST